MHALVTSVLENWNSFYSNHAVIRTCISFFHIGGLVLGGGCAIAADRMTLRAAKRSTTERSHQLDALRSTHRIVLVSLAAVAVSGLLLFAADSDTFLHSRFFWMKMGLVVALMVNGYLLTCAERKVETDAVRGWKWLTVTSTMSVVLWMLTTLAGAALPNIG
jgi:cytochrome bd-type quinol oxidase subunit 2